MSSRKQQKVPLKPWETATTDGLSDPYIRIGRSLLNHPAFIALKPLSQVLYFRMIERAAGKSAFEFPHSVYSQYCLRARKTSIRFRLIGEPTYPRPFKG